MKKTIVKLAAVILLLIVGMNNAYALETVGPFKIRKLYVSNGSNLHFRIYSDTVIPHCTGGPADGWSYVEDTDSGAKGKIATLLMAYAQQKTVYLHTVLDNTLGPYCRIIEIEVQ